MSLTVLQADASTALCLWHLLEKRIFLNWPELTRTVSTFFPLCFMPSSQLYAFACSVLLQAGIKNQRLKILSCSIWKFSCPAWPPPECFEIISEMNEKEWSEFKNHVQKPLIFDEKFETILSFGFYNLGERRW